MRDAITDIFLQIDEGPDERFVAELRRMALDELMREDDAPSPASVADVDRHPEPTHPAEVVVRPIAEATRSRGARRRRIIVLIAAAVAAAAIVIPIVRSESHPVIDDIDDVTTTTLTDTSIPSVPPTVAVTSTTAATAAASGFSNQFSGDVTTPDGQTFHVVADVAIPTPIATETELLNRDDLLVAPRVSIVVTADDPAATVIDAYAQIYFDHDFTDCVLNANAVACDPFLLSQRAAAPSATEVGDGLTFPAPDTPSTVGKIRLSAAAVDLALGKFSQGGLVHGIALVVDASPADAPDTAVGTVGFTADGAQVLTCSSLPSDCESGTTPLTGGITLSTSGPLVEPLPQGQFSAGTFEIPEQAVALSISTAGTWFVDSLFANELVLTRGVVGESQLIVVNTYAPGGEITTAAEAVANICPPGTIDFGPRTDTTMLGLPALQVEGPVLAECPRLGTLHGAIGDVNMQLEIGTDYTVRIRAVDIDGNVVVIVGISPTAKWPAFSAELDATTLQQDT